MTAFALRCPRAPSFLVTCFAALYFVGSFLVPSLRADSIAPDAVPPHRIILFIGDGMGVEHVKLARCFENGNTGPLNFEDPQQFPFYTRVLTRNATNDVTDSAAGGTALATGHKVLNHVVSTAIPGDAHSLATILELIQQRGGRAGLVTHSVHLTDATPAVFGAHQTNRVMFAAILDDYLRRSRPNVLFGQRHPEAFPDAAAYEARATAAGYHVVRHPDDLEALDPTRTPYVFASWTTNTEPALAGLTAAALRIVDQGTNAFFLLVEEELTDEAAHFHDATGVIRGVLDLRLAVAAALEHTRHHPDTLILVTGDHETGGLTVGAGPYRPGVVPPTAWATTGHTLLPVGLWARGPLSANLPGIIDNTDVFRLMRGQPPVTKPVAPAKPADN